MAARELLPLVRSLCELTEAQVAAARSLQSELLQELNGRRMDMVFDLRVVMATPVDPADPDKAELSREVLRLHRAEERLTSIAGTVIETLDSIASSGPSRTYGRSGRLQG